MNDFYVQHNVFKCKGYTQCPSNPGWESVGLLEDEQRKPDNTGYAPVRDNPCLVTGYFTYDKICLFHFFRYHKIKMNKWIWESNSCDIPPSDTSAWQILAHSSHAFSRKCLETEHFTCFSKSKSSQNDKNQQPATKM